ncbi:GNAT family N-acetyltransferase [Lentzea sp.]|uniref:GNAT family N-acetyltransferase n=1 Tax=Lentzea sp. TaxID=56099 RepID=UPI002ED3D203
MDITFRSSRGLDVAASDDSAGSVFRAFYEGYDQAFTLPDEKESREGFVECMDLNRGPDFRRISARLGPFRELVVTAEIDGVPAGGANFLVTPLPDHAVVTLNLNYLFVRPGLRGRGLSRRLVDACRELAEWLFPCGGPVLVFLEMNDPLLITAEQYEQDSAVSGIDQFDRIAIWAKLGVRIVDFPYVQPPLSAAQEADGNLLYGLLADSPVELTGGLLADHLERFFAISVLKNGDVESNELAAEQVRTCRRIGSIGLLDPLPGLADLRQKVGTASNGIRRELVAHAT